MDNCRKSKNFLNLTNLRRQCLMSNVGLQHIRPDTLNEILKNISLLASPQQSIRKNSRGQ